MDTSHENKKRQLDEADSNPSRAKRARPMAAAAEVGPECNPEQAEQQTVIKQPKPIPPLHSSFLENSADLAHFVSEWLESVVSDRVKPCRSDSYLYFSDNILLDEDLPPRRRTKSVLEMPSTRDADGFAVPPTPPTPPTPLSNLRSFTAAERTESLISSTRSSKANLVDNRNYRLLNLDSNNVFIRQEYDEMPDEVANLVSRMSKDRSTPEPSPDVVRRDRALKRLEHDGLDKASVETYFVKQVFPNPAEWSCLMTSERIPMNKDVVPNTDYSCRIINPSPDLIYGYDMAQTFSRPSLLLNSTKCSPVANNFGLSFPFLVVKFKGNSGDMWVATNQCVGASVSCINMIEGFKDRLPQREDETAIDNGVFSIAMNATEARLFVTWVENDGGQKQFFMQKVEAFLLQQPEGYIEFRRCVRNIIEWGANKRLGQIRNVLDLVDCRCSMKEALVT